MLELLSVGGLIVEIMRPEKGMPFEDIHPFIGPFPSGASAITINTAARLGMKTGIIGITGNDVFGKVAFSRMFSDKVDLSHMLILDGLTTGVAFVMYNEDGSRKFHYCIDYSKVDLADSRLQFTGLSNWIHLNGTQLAPKSIWRPLCDRTIEHVIKNGGSLSFDTNFRPELTDMESCRINYTPYIQKSRYFLPNFQEMLAFFETKSIEKAIDKAFKLGPEIIVVKNGEKGCIVADQKSGLINVPGFFVNCVDPTGAGDSFNAAFLVARERNLNLEEAGLFANAVGALATTKLGPMQGAPTIDELREFLLYNHKEYLYNKVYG